MMFFGRSVITTLVYVAFTAVVACGGSHPDAASPASRSASASIPDVGSASPDPSAATSPVVNPPASQTAAASTKADGSDIIPPFPSAGASGASGKKNAAPAKTARKVAKKKVATTE